MKTWYVLTAIVLWGFKCGKPGDTYHSVYIQNNAAHPLEFYVAALGIPHLYPDTLLPTNKPAFQTIAPGKSAPWRISLTFDQFFEELPADTLSIYLFHPDTLSKYAWEVIRSEYKVLRRYDLSHDDLKNRDFVIGYP